MQYLTFRLNGVEYAVDVTIVDTVVEDGETTAVPSPVDYMKGVMDLRGQVVPVIDLRKKFGLPEAQDRSRASVIVFTVESGDNRSFTVGALVDEVSAVVTIEEASIEKARSEGVALWERYVRGVVRFEERMVVIVEAEGLFSIREIEALRLAA
ncbi:MAG TPA: chemotaxis protein CheW [Rectinemataceae bacterium]|nr:chemotaxis protein CheW [Rectinemataceae bacterium]